MEPARALGIHMTMRGGEANTSGRALPETAKSDFTAFYEQEFTQAARFAWLLVRSSAVAEDLAQEAFVALSRRFEEIDNPRGFVHRVVVNQARTWQRDERRHTLKLARLSREYGPLTPPDVELFDLVGTLPFRQRVVIVTRYWLGWSEAEIAAVLDCRPGTVKSLASRALVRLRMEIDDDDRG
jgi:DNA-directed RNA polymerase specialized sigma24 family protein